MAIKFRSLTENEVECRVATCSERGVSLLLYKDARADMNILDETVGSENWQRKHQVVNGNLFCTVSIFDETKREWISKEDVGVESYTEKEKGQASDSFKRACVNWGIGRELYTSPFIWIPSGSVKMEQKNGKWTTKDIFRVSRMSVENGKITELVIFNSKTNKQVYSYGKDKPIQNNQPKPQQKPEPDPVSRQEDEKKKKKKMRQLWATANEVGKTNEQIHDFIVKAFGKESVKDLTIGEIDAIIKRLKGAK